MTREIEALVVRGAEGMALYIDGKRVAGPKPWGGGSTIYTFKADRDAILTALSAGEGLRVFKDESGLWVAHDVERDVVGQGKTRTAAVRGLAEAEESQDAADAHVTALAAPAPQEDEQ